MRNDEPDLPVLLGAKQEVDPGGPLLLQDLDRSKDDLPMVCVLDPDLHQVIVAHQLDRLEVLVAVLLKVVDVCRDGKELKPGAYDARFYLSLLLNHHLLIDRGNLFKVKTRINLNNQQISLDDDYS